MSPDGSVTTWITQLKSGEEDALSRLHDRYWPKLVALARQKLEGAPGHGVDEEDIAQDAFWSFYRRFRAGTPFQLASRHDLLALLTHIVACKAINQMQFERAQKRGGGRVRAQSSLNEGVSECLLDLAESSEPTPLEQALLNDSYQYYVGRLPASIRDFAQLHLAGWTHEEIAAHLGCVVRTVERKMALITRKWEEMGIEEVAEVSGSSP
jgi:DNA-directed RNA polymerase specialized sigma24 family protein